ncbi:MAG: hypothetical protein QOE61_3420 [Micromonosporaceae bacterium]|jgi:hypothetical protein|nr:hypothetical protein [Micromonosporaceae bacterium]
MATRTQPTLRICGPRHAARGWLAVAWAIWPGVWCSWSRPECKRRYSDSGPQSRPQRPVALRPTTFPLMVLGPALSTCHRNVSQRRFMRCVAHTTWPHRTVVAHITTTRDSRRRREALDRCCAGTQRARRADLSPPATRADKAAPCADPSTLNISGSFRRVLVEGARPLSPGAGGVAPHPAPASDGPAGAYRAGAGVVGAVNRKPRPPGVSSSGPHSGRR